MASSPDAYGASAAIPRDAASLVVVDSGCKPRRVLLGKRRRTQVFAPGKFVFPGGSVDLADIEYESGQQLAEHDRAALLHGPVPQSGPFRPESFGLAAIREAFEETGIVIGQPAPAAAKSVPPGWQPFHAHGFEPNLAALSFVGRAITPPGRTRRFDARFFLADAGAIVHQAETHDGEFEEIGWFDFAAARALNLHGVTLEILQDVDHFLSLTRLERQSAPVPFYFETAGGWQRSHIER